MAMLGFPPRPTSILPNPDTFNPDEWIWQYKYRGWRWVNYKNISYTRQGNEIPITTNFRTDFEYQLDGEIVSSILPQTEYQVRRAIKDGTYILKMFDIYIPKDPEMPLLDRQAVLRYYFGATPETFSLESYAQIPELVNNAKEKGMEGIVLKKKDGIYQISKLCELVPNDWVKVK